IELEVRVKNTAALTNALSPHTFMEDAVLSPTLLTPQFLDRAANLVEPEHEDLLKWKRLWREHEFSRQLFLAASRHFQTKELVWATDERGSAGQNSSSVTIDQ